MYVKLSYTLRQIQCDCGGRFMRNEYTDARGSIKRTIKRSPNQIESNPTFGIFNPFDFFYVFIAQRFPHPFHFFTLIVFTFWHAKNFHRINWYEFGTLYYRSEKYTISDYLAENSSNFFTFSISYSWRFNKNLCQFLEEKLKNLMWPKFSRTCLFFDSMPVTFRYCSIAHLRIYSRALTIYCGCCHMLHCLCPNGDSQSDRIEKEEPRTHLQTSEQVAPFNFIDVMKWRNQVAPVPKSIRNKRNKNEYRIGYTHNNSWIMKKVWIHRHTPTPTQIYFRA